MIVGRAFELKGLAYRGSLEDPEVKRWYMNVRRGFKVAADVYLRMTVFAARTG